MEVVVFTNGCFDILHPGHIELLQKARRLGTKLIVGINSDRSVRAIKGHPRPFLNEIDRAAILKELRSVDDVFIFDENTPERLIREIRPDVLVKGGDWAPEQIVGADFVLKNGGKVFSIPFESDFSSSKIVEKIKKSESEGEALHEIKNVRLEFVKNKIQDYAENFHDLLKYQAENICNCAELIAQTIQNGGKILLCLENENFLKEQFLDVELAECFENTKFIKASDLIETDYSASIEKNFQSGDLLVGISEKGDNPKILEAVMKARQTGCGTIILTSKEGKKVAGVSENNIIFSTNNETQIKFLTAFVFNIWSDLIKVKSK